MASEGLATAKSATLFVVDATVVAAASVAVDVLASAPVDTDTDTAAAIAAADAAAVCSVAIAARRGPSRSRLRAALRSRSWTTWQAGHSQDRCCRVKARLMAPQAEQVLLLGNQRSTTTSWRSTTSQRSNGIAERPIDSSARDDRLKSMRSSHHAVPAPRRHHKRRRALGESGKADGASRIHRLRFCPCAMNNIIGSDLQPFLKPWTDVPLPRNLLCLRPPKAASSRPVSSLLRFRARCGWRWCRKTTRGFGLHQVRVTIPD